MVHDDDDDDNNEKGGESDKELAAAEMNVVEMEENENKHDDNVNRTDTQDLNNDSTEETAADVSLAHDSRSSRSGTRIHALAGRGGRSANHADRVGRKMRHFNATAGKRVDAENNAIQSSQNNSDGEVEEEETGEAPGDAIANALATNNTGNAAVAAATDTIRPNLPGQDRNSYRERMARKTQCTEETKDDEASAPDNENDETAVQPGAYPAPGRAFGSFPAWARHASDRFRRRSTIRVEAVLVEEKESTPIQAMQEAIPLVKPWRKREVLQAAVETFYERLLKDPDITPFFVGIDLRRLKLHQYNFMSVAFSDIPADIDVIDLLKKKHKRLFDMGLSEKHFDILLGHFVDTLQDLGVPQDFIDEAVMDGLEPKRPVFVEGHREAEERKLVRKTRQRVLATAGAVGVVGIAAILLLRRRTK